MSTLRFFFLQKVKWSHWKTWKLFFLFANRTFSYASSVFDLFFFISCISKIVEKFEPNRNHIQLHFTEVSFIFVWYLKTALSKHFRIFWFPEKENKLFPAHTTIMKNKQKEEQKKRKKKRTTKTYVDSIALHTHTHWMRDGGGKRKWKKEEEKS